MPGIAITPLGAMPRPVTGSSKTAGTGRLAIRIGATLSLILGFQAMAAAPAGIATLPSALFTRPALVASPAPELGLSPDLFRAIIEAVFPSSSAVKPVTSLPVPVETAGNPDELIPFSGRTVPRWLVHSILKAAHVTGTDPVYMMTLADVESSLSNEARAPTSSAAGLFQFIESTWIETVYNHAADYGFEAAAKAIRYVDGERVIPDEKDRAWIMSLRTDPYFSALMAGALIKDVERALQAEGERELAEAELYLAHFLGATAAIEFLEVLDSSPDTSATKLFPKAARANVGLFMEGKGRKRRAVSVAELYNRIDTKIIRRMDRYEDIGPILAEVNAPVATAARLEAYASVQ